MRTSGTSVLARTTTERWGRGCPAGLGVTLRHDLSKLKLLIKNGYDVNQDERRQDKSCVDSIDGLIY